MGYIILITLLAFVVYLFRQEQIKESLLDKGETELFHTRLLAERTFVSLLDLASRAEIAIAWEEEDYEEYCRRRKAVCDTLQLLKADVSTAIHQIQIDSLCALLTAKEELLTLTMTTFRQLQEVSNLVQKKIPAIVSQVQSIPEAKTNEIVVKPQWERTERRGFLGLFRRKEQKSAYLKQKEQSVQKSHRQAPTSTVFTTADMLRSLNREVVKRQEEQQARLLAQMDSLYTHSTRLNRKMNNLTVDIEQETAHRLALRYRNYIKERETSYSIVSVLAIFITLLTVILYIIIHRDLSRRFRYEKELEASNKRSTELLQSRKNMLLTIAHDLRSPLAAISGYAELMPEEKEEEQRNRYATNILYVSRHVTRLANNLLYYYRLETGKEQMNREIFHPGRAIENAVQAFRLSAQKKGLGLTTELKDMNTVVEGDRTRLEQILHNLLSNALKFTQTGYVHVGGNYEKDRLYFFVRDTGPGISAESQKRIFTAFERAEGENTQSGFGLGLYITAKLVTMLDGIINVESREGQGSTFEISLPMPEAGGQEVGDKTKTDYPDLSGLRIALIDDDRIQADMTKRMLARNGITCDCCHNVKELIELLRVKLYHLLLTDMHMPETDGYHILALLRNSNLGKSKDIPVVAVTARVDEEVERFSEAGFTGCLFKPFSMSQLRTVVAEATSNCHHTLPEADFTALLDGEEDRKEMLGMFIQDTGKAVADLREAIERKDGKRISVLIHKGIPLWEIIHIGIPVTELEELASLSPTMWNEAIFIKVRKLADAVEQAVKTAIRLREETE